MYVRFWPTLILNLLFHLLTILKSLICFGAGRHQDAVPLPTQEQQPQQQQLTDLFLEHQVLQAQQHEQQQQQTREKLQVVAIY